MKKLALAVIVVLVAASAALAVRWVFPRNEPTEPATGAALAAAAQRHMPPEAKLLSVSDGGNVPSVRILVNLEYEIGGRQVTISVEANKDMTWAADYCTPDPAVDETCEIRTLGDGTKVAVSHLGGKTPITGASTQRAGHSVWVSVWPSAGVSDLPVSFDVLAAIAADPLIGLKTSRQMLDRGSQIAVTPMSPSRTPS